MMIRPTDEELEHTIHIALITAQTYALRDVFSKTRALNRRVAVDTLTARLMTILRRYEIMREARPNELDDATLPLFPELESRDRPDERTD